MGFFNRRRPQPTPQARKEVRLRLISEAGEAAVGLTLARHYGSDAEIMEAGIKAERARVALSAYQTQLMW